ncbi:MAG TPA: M28 family metallopeptidase [Sphingomicrobium sp.]|nr:M28 family metallopeptidase [Sphingomicrobium sp.]
MKRALIAAALAIAGCSRQGGEQSAAPEFSSDRMKADVAFLADDKLEGRFTGSSGYMAAAKYVSDQFAEIGLNPGNNGSWYQQVPFAEARRKPGEPSYIRIGDREFPNGVDVVMTPNGAFPDQSMDVEAVFVGYGIDGPEIGSNDYAGMDVRGKVAVVLFPFPKGAPSETAAHMLNEKAAMAKRHGAVGLLSIHTPVREKVIKWELMGDRANQPDVKWIGEDGKPRYPGPNLPLSATLGPKAAQALFEGEATPLAQIYAEMDKDGGKPKGFALKKMLHIERHSNVRRMQSPNVIGVLEGSDPALRHEYIVLSAHLDALGRVKPENGDDIVNGAMDNAMGVATMLEVARAFAKDGKRPKRSILFAALTGEEQGLLGAEYLASHPVIGAGKVVGLVNLDMPIVTYDFQDLVAYGAEHSTISQAVARAARAVGIRLTPDPAPEQVSFVRTDHYPFVKAGVPAVSLDLGPAGPGAKATEDFIANHYHRVSDDMKLPFHWAGAARFAKINYLIARELTDGSDAPRWYNGDYFGEQFAKAAPKANR